MAKSIIETQAVVESFFDGRAPRGVVTESTIKQTINSILTRTNDSYAIPTVVYDTGVIIDTGAGTTSASNLTVAQNVTADPSGTPATLAEAGTIVITEYDSNTIYTVTPTVTGNVDQGEYKIVTGDQGNAEVSYQPWDKVSVNYQSGVLTIQGKITEDIFERPIVISFENAYFDRVEVVMLLTVGLDPVTP